MSRFQNPRPQYLDISGDPLPLAEMNFYETGTTVRKDTFSDINLTTVNANPLPLNADGSIPNCFYDGVARAILTYDAGAGAVQRFDVDGVGSSSISAAFSVWASIITYEKGALVEGSDGLYYRSLQAANIANDPTSSASYWETIAFLRTWNVNITYPDGQIIVGSNGVIYSSIQAANINHEPSASPLWWLANGPFDQDLNTTDGVSFADLTTTGNITGGTIEATTDTSAGDNAAIGYTSAEGLVLTGQGSTSDITLKNDADAAVMNIPTGTTTAKFAGDVTLGDAATNGQSLTLDGWAANGSEISSQIIFQNTTSVPSDEVLCAIRAETSSSGRRNGTLAFYTGASGADTLALSISHTQVATFEGDVALTTGKLTVNDGTNNLPLTLASTDAGCGITFQDNTTTGTGSQITTVGDVISIKTTGVEAVAFDASQNTTFAGNINAVAGGINLGATGSANLLQDYEDGIWSLVISDSSSGGNLAVFTQECTYTKIGRLVTVEGSALNINTATNSMTAVNNLFFRGLPFVSSSSSNGVGGAVIQQFALGTATYVNMSVQPNTDYFFLRTITSGGGRDQLRVNSITSGVSDVEQFTLTYHV